MFKTIQIISTVVFAVFCVLAATSVYNLGLGWYAVPLVALVFAGVMWEVWIQPKRDEAIRKELLTGIGDWDYSVKINNLSDAKDAVDILETRVEYVTEAYATLKAEQEEKE